MWILNTCLGLESVPDLVLAKDWKSHKRKDDLQCDWKVLFAFGVLFQYIGYKMETKLFYDFGFELGPNTTLRWLLPLNWNISLGVGSHKNHCRFGFVTLEYNCSLLSDLNPLSFFTNPPLTNKKNWDNIIIIICYLGNTR